MCSEVCSTSWKGAGSILALLKSTSWSSCCSSHSRIWGGAIGQGKGYSLPTSASKGPPILLTPYTLHPPYTWSYGESWVIHPSPRPPHALAPLWDPSEQEGPARLCPTPHLCWGHLVTQNHLLLQEKCVGAALRPLRAEYGQGAAGNSEGGGSTCRQSTARVQAGYRQPVGRSENVIG